MTHRWTRRRFVGRTALAGLGLTILKDSRSARGAPANERLNLAIIGCGGRGRAFAQREGCCALGGSERVRVAFLCDVDEQKAAAALRDFPEAVKGNDYRRMFERHSKEIDAVIVATGDYAHAPASSAAIRAGKPVYCEKPLTVAVYEARMLARRATEHKVATQMGNQNGYPRKAVNAVWSGMIGEVHEAHAWCASAGPGRRPLPAGAHAVPPTLQWDLWLGPAPYRDYHPAWMNWLGWREFGTSMLGNRGSHSMATLFMALKIGELWNAPTAAPHPIIKVTGECDELCLYSLPKQEKVLWQVPARAGMPPVKVWWYGGSPEEARPRLEELSGRKLDFGGPGEQWKSWLGSLIVGEKRTIICGGFAELSGDKIEDLNPPELLPEDMGDPGMKGFFDAVLGSPKKPMSSFDGFSGPYTEFQLLAHVATQFPGEELEFDPVDCRITNNSLADCALRREYREGWTL